MRPWPKNFKNLPLYFVSTEPIPRIHGAQTYQRTRLWVPQLGKIIYRIFFVLSQFLFSIAFFRTKMVHRVFSWHLGFAGMFIIIFLQQKNSPNVFASILEAKRPRKFQLRTTFTRHALPKVFRPGGAQKNHPMKNPVVNGRSGY